MSVRDNIRESLYAFINLEGSKVAFADKVGVTKSAVTNWTNGNNAPDIETIAKISNMYDVPLSDILEGRVTSDEVEEPCTRWVRVPMYGSIAAGKPIEMAVVDGEMSIPIEMHRKYPHSFLLRVEGESMNKRLPNGSLALINPTKDVIDGHAYAVAVNGYNATIKRVKKYENGLELIPDSTDPTIKPKVYDFGDASTETVTVIGEVVWCVYPFDYEV